MGLALWLRRSQLFHLARELFSIVSIQPHDYFILSLKFLVIQ
jgi:hypothetical protein